MELQSGCLVDSVGPCHMVEWQQTILLQHLFPTKRVIFHISLTKPSQTAKRTFLGFIYSGLLVFPCANFAFIFDLEVIGSTQDFVYCWEFCLFSPATWQCSLPNKFIQHTFKCLIPWVGCTLEMVSVHVHCLRFDEPMDLAMSLSSMRVMAQDESDWTVKSRSELIFQCVHCFSQPVQYRALQTIQ